MNAPAISNDELTINNDKVTVTEVGLHFRERLTDEEWTSLGNRIGRLAKASMFMVGDWLIHREAELGGGKHGGDRHGGKGRPGEIEERYQQAAEITGLNVDTLADSAWVCRSVAINSRRTELTFTHHRIVARYDEPTQTKWLKLAEKHKMGKRRMARSIEAGRVLKPEELQPAQNDNAIETFCVWVNRICGLWRRFQDAGYISEASPEKKEAMRRDLRPVVEIYEELAK
ncbi:MAG: hypothetical protein WCH98_01060 [Verrucomicrobiota bacterium]